jgi:phosphoribosyl 1,2-cyclic phosphodiesterase
MRGRASEVYCAKTGTVTVFRDTRRFTLLTCVMSPHDGMSYVRLSVHKSLTMRINNYQLGTRYNLYEKLQGSNFYFKRTHYHGKSSSNGKANSIVPTSVAITASAVLSLLLERDGSRTLADSGTTESNCKEMNDLVDPPLHTNKLLFLGTGSSTGCPRPLCTMLFPRLVKTELGVHRQVDPDENSLTSLQKYYEPYCSVSRLAVQGDPVQNKNYRNNPSILISHKTSTRTERRNIIIDVGKTFREGAIRWISHTNDNAAHYDDTIRSIDAIILTHEHMDSIGGLDDVRGCQIRQNDGTLKPISVYLTQQTLQALRRQFHYLVPDVAGLKKDNNQNNEKITTVQPVNEESTVVKRMVAVLNYELIEQFKPFVAGGMTFTPVPVMHGEDMICMGFAFSIPYTKASKIPTSTTVPPSHHSSTNSNEATAIHILYLSDISRLPQETEQFILTQLPPTNILIIDSLHVEASNATHVCLREAIAVAKRLQPDKVYLVGMNCDDFLPHEEMNKLLRKKKCEGDSYGLDIELAYDGLVLEF